MSQLLRLGWKKQSLCWRWSGSLVGKISGFSIYHKLSSVAFCRDGEFLTVTCRKSDDRMRGVISISSLRASSGSKLADNSGGRALLPLHLLGKLSGVNASLLSAITGSPTPLSWDISGAPEVQFAPTAQRLRPSTMAQSKSLPCGDGSERMMCKRVRRCLLSGCRWP
jgi:hypothetical protein